MDTKIVEFTHLLRRNGIRVSLSENMDSFRAVELIGLTDRVAFKNALRASIVKRHIDAPMFDDLFDLYFTGLGEVVKGSASSLMGALQLDEAGFQQLLETLADLLKDLGIELSELAQHLLSNDTGQLEKQLRAAAAAAQVQNIQRSFQEGRYSHSMAQMLGLGALAQELDGLKAQLADADLDPALLQQLQRLIDRRLQDLTDMIKRAVRVELEKQDFTQRENSRLQTLAEKSFSTSPRTRSGA